MNIKSIIPIIIVMSFPAMAFMPKTQSDDPQMNGKIIFEKKCAKCHGKDGTKGLFGAKNLPASKLTDPELFNIICNGKKIMPSWGKRLTKEEIGQVIVYIKTLRK